MQIDRPLLIFLPALAVLSLGLFSPARGDGGNGVTDLPTATASDGPVYPVSSFDFRYAVDDEALPDASSLLTTEVELFRVPSGYVAPRDRVENQAVMIGNVGKLGVTPFHGSALQAIARKIVADFNERGLIGVYVRPSPAQIDDTGRDLREAGDAALSFIVYTAHVSQIRTLANGERFPPDQGIDNPNHVRIRNLSPVRQGDLVDKKQLDEYIAFLNRHPGRRVDVALGPGDEPGGAVLDYMVIENKPWSVYFQAANTGTESTGEWRYRFGFQHTQLTNADDIVQLDYITSEFKGSHALVGSYTRPVFDVKRWRARAQGGWSTFDAADLADLTGSYTGDQWWAGGDLIYNVWQRGKWFVDLTGGFEWRHISVDNQIVLVDGASDFLLVHGGASVEFNDEIATTFAMVDLQGNLSGLADTKTADVVKLGRVEVEKDFLVLTWQAMQSVYLEPLLFPDAWADITTPQSSTLAHEVMVLFRGQTTFGERVAPQFEGIAGGMYTVRGYDESTAAGDDLYLFTAEYRFHVPRVFAVDENPYDTMLFGKPFRWAPQEVYGRPDWDLILKAFVDLGATRVNDPVIGESNEDLLGVGIGAELQVKRNLNVRVDYGWALEDAGSTRSGDSRLHFQGTLLY